MTVPQIWVSLFFINMASVSLRVWQQLNVMQSEYLAIVPTSYGMAAMLVLTTLGVVSLGKSLPHQGVGIVCIGTGGWIGSWISIYLHNIVFGG